jgi:DNA invertase Pin-like site-specific DNA recombinase
MVRAGVYVRYSSDNQSDALIEDQVEVCRRYAEVQGWEIIEVYPDRALSGAIRFRPAFEQMQVDAEARRFDVIIVEALDRLSRKLADVADLHDRLTFPEIRSHAVNTSEITAVHAAQAERNVSSINAEIIRCVRDAMDRADCQVRQAAIQADAP